MITREHQIIGFIIAGGVSLSVLQMVQFSPFEGSKHFEFVLIMLAGIAFTLAMLYFIKNVESSNSGESDNR